MIRYLAPLTRRVPSTRVFDPVIVALLYYAFRLSQRLPGRTAKSHLVRTQIFGFTLSLDLSEFVDCAVYLFPQCYDRREIQMITRRLRPGDVFLDVGAHFGFYSLFASRAVGPAGKVLAIDAHPGMCEQLRRTMDDNAAANVRVLNVGVSDRRETLRFQADEAPFRARSTFLGGSGALPVECKPLLDILLEEGVTRVKAAKFDIEGYEAKVLARFLRDAPEDLLPELIVVEANPELIQAGGDPLPLLREYGYRTRGHNLVNYMMTRPRRAEAVATARGAKARDSLQGATR
jgi:FkbM family methyltransferase